MAKKYKLSKETQIKCAEFHTLLGIKDRLIESKVFFWHSRIKKLAKDVANVGHEFWEMVHEEYPELKGKHLRTAGKTYSSHVEIVE